jgi:hypothetical protein
LVFIKVLLDIILPLVIKAQTEIGDDSSENDKKLQDFKKGKDKALLSESLLACRRSVGDCILNYRII